MWGPRAHCLERVPPPPYGALPMGIRFWTFSISALLMHLAFLASGCTGGGGKKESEAPHAALSAPEPTSGLLRSATAIKKKPDAPRFVASVEPGSLGPHLVMKGGMGVVVWINPEGPDAGYYSVHVPTSKDPLDAQKVSEVAPGVRQISVGATKEGNLAIATIRKSGENDILEVLHLGSQGELRGLVHRATETSANILWTQIVPTVTGGLLFWIEQDSQGADVYATSLHDQQTGQPQRLVRRVSSWQVVHGKLGISLVTLEGGAPGQLKLRQLGDAGQVIGTPIQLAGNVPGAQDLDLAMTEERIIVAWTQKDDFEARLHRVILDGSGNILHPDGGLTLREREQALVKVLGSPDSKDALVVWEQPLGRQEGRRSLLMGTLPGDGDRVSEVRELEVSGQDPLLPSFSQNKEKIAILSQMSSASADVKVAIRVQGEETSVKELTLDRDGAVEMAWDLSCGPSECYYLLADHGTPTSVYLAQVGSTDSDLQPLAKTSHTQFPRIVGTRVIAEVPELSALSGAQLADEELLFWISYFDPSRPYKKSAKAAPDGRKAPLRARLSTMNVARKMEERDSLLQREHIVSYRARSLGGVAVVKPENNRGLLLWAALDGKSPQLFATAIDATGKRVQQKMLTREKGEVTDVAATRVPGGYLLVWVDSRSGTPEIFTQKIDQSLRTVSKAQAIYQGKAAPTGLSLASVEESIVLLFSTSSPASSADVSHLHTLVLDPKSGKPRASSRTVISSKMHMHSPQLRGLKRAAGGQGAMCTWIEMETGSTGVQAQPRGALHWAEVDADGRLVTQVNKTSLEGSVVEVSLSCSETRCRALASLERDFQGRVLGSLWGVQFEDDGGATANMLMPLRVGVTTGVTPFLLGDDAFFADADEARERWLLRRANIQWEKPSPVQPGSVASASR